MSAPPVEVKKEKPEGGDVGLPKPKRVPQNPSTPLTGAPKRASRTKRSSKWTSPPDTPSSRGSDKLESNEYEEISKSYFNSLVELEDNDEEKVDAIYEIIKGALTYLKIDDILGHRNMAHGIHKISTHNKHLVATVDGLEDYDDSIDSLSTASETKSIEEAVLRLTKPSDYQTAESRVMFQEFTGVIDDYARRFHLYGKLDPVFIAAIDAVLLAIQTRAATLGVSPISAELNNVQRTRDLFNAIRYDNQLLRVLGVAVGAFMMVRSATRDRYYAKQIEAARLDYVRQIDTIIPYVYVKDAKTNLDRYYQIAYSTGPYSSVNAASVRARQVNVRRGKI